MNWSTPMRPAIIASRTYIVTMPKEVKKKRDKRLLRGGKKIYCWRFDINATGDQRDRKNARKKKKRTSSEVADGSDGVP